MNHVQTATPRVTLTPRRLQLVSTDAKSGVPEDAQIVLEVAEGVAFRVVGVTESRGQIVVNLKASNP